MNTIVEPARAPHATSRLAEHRGRIYMFYYMIIPLLAYVFPFIAERTAPLDRMSVTYGGSILDHGHGLAGENADVLVFGDSTAMFGVDAARLSRELGLKVVIIPNSLGSLANTEDWALQEYLRGNKPPRLIVFQAAPWNLDFHQVPNPAPFEGDEEIFRHADFRELVRFIRKNPRDLLYFPFRFYASPIPLTNLHAWGKPALAHVVQGFTPNPMQLSLQPGCSLPEIETKLQQTGSFQSLLRRYSSGQTKTIAYLSPIPGCVNAEKVAKRTYPGLSVAPPVVVPPQYIGADYTHAHPVAEHVPQTTDLLAKFLSSSLSGSAIPTQP